MGSMSVALVSPAGALPTCSLLLRLRPGSGHHELERVDCVHGHPLFRKEPSGPDEQQSLTIVKFCVGGLKGGFHARCEFTRALRHGIDCLYWAAVRREKAGREEDSRISRVSNVFERSHPTVVCGPCGIVMRCACRGRGSAWAALPPCAMRKSSVRLGYRCAIAQQQCIVAGRRSSPHEPRAPHSRARVLVMATEHGWGADEAGDAMLADAHLGPSFKATLKMLEWPTLCDHLAEFASTHSGRRLCLNLTVPPSLTETERLLLETRWAPAHACTCMQASWQADEGALSPLYTMPCA